MSRPLIVLGAGIGGLSAAIRLAVSGHDVEVWEKNDAPGGKMGRDVEAGYTWDTGPSVLTMRSVLEELFALAGERLDDHLHLQPLDPLTRYFYRDGTILDATQDLQRMIEQIAALDARDVEGYRRFLRDAATLYRVTSPTFIHGDPPHWSQLLRVPPTDLLRFDPLRTMEQAIRRRVHHPHLRQLLMRFATYVGGSPYQTPATLNVIAHVELSQGVWYPRGGMYEVARALHALAKRVGVRVHLSRAISAIDTRNGAVAAVRSHDGTRQETGAVVANLDVTTVYERLLPADVATPARRRHHTRVEPSCSAFVLHLGVRRTFPALAHHNIFFSDDYRREFTELFEEGRPPSDPTIYVAITSKSDPSHAPKNAENWFVLVNAPALGSDWDWDRDGPAYRDHVLDRLARAGFDVRDDLDVARVVTPRDLADHSGAWRGALYGPSPNSRSSAFRRPHNRCPHVRGLYFAGGSTHPGGGVPMVALSGAVAARALKRDLARGRVSL